MMIVTTMTVTMNHYTDESDNVIEDHNVQK